MRSCWFNSSSAENKRSIPRQSLESAKTVKSQPAIVFYPREEFGDGLGRDTQSYTRAGAVAELPGERLEGVRRENGFASSACSRDTGQPAPPVPASAPGFFLTRFPARLKPRVAFRTAAARGWTGPGREVRIAAPIPRFLSSTLLGRVRVTPN